MFCGAKYAHHTFTPIIKHLITTTANKHPGKKSFIDKNVRKSHWHQAAHIPSNRGNVFHVGGQNADTGDRSKRSGTAVAEV